MDGITDSIHGIKYRNLSLSPSMSKDVKKGGDAYDQKNKDVNEAK